jgi:hypothetical protein
VTHNNVTLMQIRYGIPQFSPEIIRKDKFFSDIKRIFSDIPNENIDDLYKLSLEVTKQKKGAMLIISKDAENEAKRLSKQCINIKPIQLDSELILNLTSIDGGVILDTTGKTYAHGVILDGIVGYSGDSSRGSRYNSALTYQEYKGLDEPTMIIVVSEDGTVDVIPNLRPQIKHSEIVQVIEILEQLNNPSKYNSSAFNNTMFWLRNRQFYLTKEECDRINELKRKLVELDKIVETKTVWIVHENLLPHPQIMKHIIILKINKH